MDKLNLSDVLTTISDFSFNLNTAILAANNSCVPVIDLISNVYFLSDACLFINNAYPTKLSVGGAYYNGANKLVQSYNMSLLGNAPSCDNLQLKYTVEFLVDVKTARIIHLYICFNIHSNDFTADNVTFNCDNINSFKLPNNFSLNLFINNGYVAVNCDYAD